MTSPFPPEGYEQISSTISGISVFQPKQESESHQEVVAFSCPQCGAATAYCTDNGGLTCTHCNYYEAPENTNVSGKGSEEMAFTLTTVQRASQGWGLERKELNCNNCGGKTILPPESLSHTCPFCHSQQVVQQKANQDDLRPRFLIPLTVKANDIQSQLAEWMGNSWLLPSNLAQMAQSTSLSQVYIPFWTFDARAKAKWKAEVGKRVKQGDSYKTVWRWENGWVEHYFDDLLLNGSSHVESKLLTRINQFDLEALVPYDPSYLAGVRAQAYEVGLEDAWSQARDEMREWVRNQCQSQASTDRIRNFHMGLDFSEESWRYILLPFLVGSYEFEGKSYQVLVNGQNRQMAGNRPADWKKVKKFSLLTIVPSVLLLLAGFLIPQLPDEVVVVGTLALTASAIFSGYCYQTASQLQKI